MKKITFIKSLPVLIALFCAVNLGFGQSIFDNPITGTNPNTANPYTFGQYNDANISVSGIGRGSGIAGANANDRYNASGWGFPFANNDYFEFTLTPNAGYEIDFVNFFYTAQTGGTFGPLVFAFRSSLDGFTANIGTPNGTGTTIDLSGLPYQNISGPITFRLYAYFSINATFSINSFTFNGTVAEIPCALTATWIAGAWDLPGGPNNRKAIIADAYNTGTDGNFSTCSLIINPGVTLTVADNTFVEVQNDVTVNGTLTVETSANFVQYGNTFTGTGTVNKTTPVKANWYYYTYWSSPVQGATIADAFPLTDADRRFSFDAVNYLDIDGDGIDDYNGWTIEAGINTMTPGVGYAATSDRSGSYPGPDNTTFIGSFNNGDIPTAISYNALNIGGSWNLIGNPYPGALDFDAFHAANSIVVDGAAYFWSQASPPLAINPGNEGLNFNQNDYAIYTVESGGAAGGSPDIPTQYVPSAQGFFVAGLSNADATFTNSMRMADATSNNLFFKTPNKQSKSNNSANKLWINLTSDNGVFGQILIAYVDGATNDNDGLSYDAPKLLSNNASILYSTMEGSNKIFAIQGKAPSSLNESEAIKLGFNTSINVPTIYTLSVAQLQGDFLSNNKVYLKDNLTNTIHDLSASDYNFTSEVGEFTNRFEIVFKAQALSADTFDLDTNTVQIIQLDDTHVTFKASGNLNIKTVTIYDLLGRQLYQLEGSHNEETYNLSSLQHSVFIAKVALSNGALVTKKAIKK